MITEYDVFSKDAINIFTDASILKLSNGKYIGCPGYVVVSKNDVLEADCYVTGDTTSNNSEIKAVRLGIFAAERYQNYKYIRLFSDSQLCIFGLRDRIYNWMRKIHDGKVCGYDGKPIKNQEVFLEIAYYIMRKNIRIEFFHQRGHISLASPQALKTAHDDFLRFNNVKDVSSDLIGRLSYYNNMVDSMTRSKLNSGLLDICFDPYQFRYVTKDFAPYKALTCNRSTTMKEN